MTLRLGVLGLMVLIGFSVWSWCRPCGTQAQTQTADPVCAGDDQIEGTGGTHDEARDRYRANQSTHWRQVAIGGSRRP